MDKLQPSRQSVGIMIHLSLCRLMISDLLWAIQWVCLIYTRKETSCSLNHHSHHTPFLLFSRFYMVLKKLHLFNSYWKEPNPKTLCSVETEQWIAKQGTCCGKYILTTWKRLSGFKPIKKCMFHLACLKQWRDSSQWCCCVNLDATIYVQVRPVCCFINLSSHTNTTDELISRWRASVLSPNKIISHSFCMRKIRW